MPLCDVITSVVALCLEQLHLRVVLADFVILLHQELTYREALHCVLTAFTILSGQGEALNIDPLTFYQHLYRVLYQLHIGTCTCACRVKHIHVHSCIPFLSCTSS